MDNFKLEKNGYDKKEVDEFVEKVKRDYEDTMQDQMDRISELKKQLDETNKKLGSYEKKNGDISDALVVAVETAKQIENASKNIYDLEIKRVRALYNKWEKFLDELMEEYPRLKERFDTKALLKIFSDGIDEVVKQNSVDSETPTQSIGLRSLISKMNKINDKTDDKNVEAIKNTVIKPKSNTYSLYDNLTSIGTVAKQQEEFDREYELFVEEQEELERQRALKLEQEKKLEQQRKQQELLLIKQQQELQAKQEEEKRVKEQLERERQEELLRQRKLEEEKLAEIKRQEKLEQERLEQQRKQQERQQLELLKAQQRLEQERLKKLEQEKKAKEEQERLEKELKEKAEKEKQEKLAQIEKEKELNREKFDKSYFEDAPQLIDEDIFLKMEESMEDPQEPVATIKRKDTQVEEESKKLEEENKKSQIKSISNLKIDEGDKFESLVDKFLSTEGDDEKSNSYENAVLNKKKKENNFDLSEALTPDDDLSTIMESFDAFNTELEKNKDGKNN